MTEGTNVIVDHPDYGKGCSGVIVSINGDTCVVALTTNTERHDLSGVHYDCKLSDCVDPLGGTTIEATLETLAAAADARDAKLLQEVVSKTSDEDALLLGIL